jgi:hypothetical protein
MAMPQGTTEERTDDAKVIPLRRGVMTNLANDITERLSFIDFGPKASRFLNRLLRKTFGDTGKHEKWGHENPGLWCTFDLSAWIGYVGVSKSSLLHLRAKLIDDGLIWYDPDPTDAGRGRLGWNTDFAEWKPLAADYPKWGGKRPRAGRPKNQDINGSLQENIQDINASQHTEDFKISTLDNSDQFKISMDACDGSAQEADPSTPLRRGSRKNGSRSDATASGDGNATPPARASPNQGRVPKRSEREPEVFEEFKRFCFVLIREQQKRVSGNIVAAQAKALFDATNGPYTDEQVEECWRALIRDPYYDATHRPCIADIIRKMENFLEDPEAFRQDIEEKRRRRGLDNGKTTPHATGRRSASAPLQAVEHYSDRNDEFS